MSGLNRAGRAVKNICPQDIFGPARYMLSVMPERMREDDSKTGQSKIQELTDQYVGIINSESSNKEKEITKI